MEHNQLFTEFNVGAARQISLSAKVRMLAEYNIKERRRLKSDEMKVLKERNTTLENEKNDLDMKVTDLTASVAVRECEVADLDALVTSVKSQNDNLVDRVHELEVSSFGLREKVTVYEDCMGQLEKFQDDRIRRLFRRACKMGYLLGLPITRKLKTNKDASVETLINILRLEETLAKRLGLNELQPHVDQLMVPIHHSPDKTVVGATALSLALDVYSVRIQRIRENIKNHRSALRDVFVPLAEPFSAATLKGTKGTSDVMTDAATTTALSTILVSISTVNPISIDDYEVIEADNQTIVDGNAASFANVDDADLHIPQ
ncbi:hypothetical protein Tco_0677168 [Tanacetum coccineum]